MKYGEKHTKCLGEAVVMVLDIYQGQRMLLQVDEASSQELGLVDSCLSFCGMGTWSLSHFTFSPAEELILYPRSPNRNPQNQPE